jgi:TolA-binding protein
MSTPAEELPIEHGFDLFAFWEEHQSKIILGIVGVLVAVGGYIIFQATKAHKIASAEAALAQANSIEQLQAVVKEHSGTNAAGNAALILGGKLRDQKKYDESIAVLNDFVEKNPTHPLVGGGLLSLGATYEAQGKNTEALQKYQEIGTKYTDSYAAPFALLAQANIERSTGKTADARRTLESIVSGYPESMLAQQAMQEMKMLKK